MLLDKFKKTAPEMAREKLIKSGKDNFRQYCNLIKPDFFKPGRAYQDVLCNTLQDFYTNKLLNPKTNNLCKILLISMPPGFGKSYTASMLATWCYGQNIKNQIIEVSYNQSLSIQFSKTVRDLIQDTEIEGDINNFTVNSFFPVVKIKYGDGAMERWSLQGYYNSYLATSFDGSITGMRGTIGIIDDPIKNANEAVNENVKNSHYHFYKNTFLSRILDNGKQIIIMTRWATDDLAGKILSEFGHIAYELKMPALVDGKSLCEDLYSTNDLLYKQAALDEHIWLANYMQEPIDIKGSLYKSFKTYDFAPHFDMFERVIAYIDTADTGNDYLCMWVAGVIGDYAYIIDAYYTDEDMSVTENETARLLHKNNVRECVIESNNGGRGFARNVERILKDSFKNKKCRVTWFHQAKNKKSRILVNASSVNDRVIVPDNFDKRYPKLYKGLMSYQRKGKNIHDDAPDSLTGLIEFINGEIKTKNKSKIGKRSLLGI